MHICAYTRDVSYEWDPPKERTNFKKHGIHFADAVVVLEDDLALTIADPFSEQEERWISLGRDVRSHPGCDLYMVGRSNPLDLSALATPREISQYGRTS